MKFRLESVRLSYPNLFTPREFKAGDGRPRFDANFIVTPGSALDKRIEAEIEKAATEKLGAKAAKFLASARGQKTQDCYREDEVDGEDVKVLSAHTKVRPTVIDRDRSPLVEADGKLYGGCYVNAIVEIWIQTGENPGVRCGFSGVQFEKHGEAFGAGAPASPDEFDNLGEGGDADDMV